MSGNFKPPASALRKCAFAALVFAGATMTVLGILLVFGYGEPRYAALLGAGVWLFLWADRKLARLVGY